MLCASLTLVSGAGCASLQDGQEYLIRVQAGRDPVKAARLTLLGVTAMNKGHRDRAADKFRAAINADRTYGPAHNNLGLLHYEQGSLYQAVLEFEQAMELMPQDPDVYYNLALALESAGRVHEAMDLYWQALEMDPINPNYLGNLVRLRIRMGEEDSDLIVQLQDLALIETRPDWRRWADRQLALFKNDALDRGPKPPEFDTGGDGESEQEYDPADNVIDLTPEPEPKRSGGNIKSERLPIGGLEPPEELPTPFVIPDRDESDRRIH